jgi:adenylate kinase
MIIEVEMPRPELMRRLSGRRWCPTCQATYHVETRPPARPGLCDRDATPLVQRDDDKEAVVARRLADYDERTRPLIRYYETRSRVHRVDGNRPVDQVFEELKGILEGVRR